MKLSAFFSACAASVKRDVARAKHRTGSAIRFVWDATDNEDRIVFTGLLLLGAGIARVNTSAALITVGVLLILAVRPLRGWFGDGGKS